MRLERTGIAALACLLAACTVAAPPAPQATPKPEGPASKKPSAAPTAGATSTAAPASAAPASASPSPVASASPSAPPARLAPPPAGAVVLRGQVKIDAGYAVATGAAILNDGGAGVISNQGAKLISDHGAGVLGGLIATDGAAIIANNGSSVIGDYGLGIAPGLIGNNGAGMIGKTKFYRTMQAAATPAGQLLPAAGLVVGLASLRRSELLPVGADAQGAPAYGLYTDAEGRWSVTVPADEAGNVLVLVRFPADPTRAATPDPRLAWDLVTPATAAAPTVDDDTSLAAQYLLSAYVNRFRDLMTTPDPDALAADIASRWVGAPPGLRALMVTLIQEFRAAADEVGLAAAPREDAERVSRQVINAILARVALDQVIVSKASNAKWVWADEPALPAMAGALGHARLKAAALLAADPAAFEKLAFFTAANANQAARGAAPYAIRKGSDFGDLVVREYLLQDKVQASYNLATDAFMQIDALVDPATGVNQVDRIAGAQSAIMTEIGRRLLLDEAGAKTEALAILRAYKKR